MIRAQHVDQTVEAALDFVQVISDVRREVRVLAVLALDDPIGKHLTGYPNKVVASKVTVRHLLTHTAGLAEWQGAKFEAKTGDEAQAIRDALAAAAYTVSV